MRCSHIQSRAASFLELPLVWLADYGRNLLWITSNVCTPIRTSLHTVSLQVQIDHSFIPRPTAVANLSQKGTSKAAYVLIQRCQQLNICLCECEEWEDGKRFYLGATQLQITHQITPIMIKAQERGLTFSSCSLGTLSASSSFFLHTYVQRE